MVTQSSMRASSSKAVSYTHLDVYKRQVIGRVGKKEQDILKDAVDRAADAVISILEEGIDRAMNRYNVRRDTSDEKGNDQHNGRG